MGASLFRSFVNQPTKDQIAAQIAEDTIREHEQARIGRESEPLDAHDLDRLQRLAALLTGPRKDAVKPVVARLWPDFAKVCDQQVGNA